MDNNDKKLLEIIRERYEKTLMERLPNAYAELLHKMYSTICNFIGNTAKSDNKDNDSLEAVKKSYKKMIIEHPPTTHEDFFKRIFCCVEFPYEACLAKCLEEKDWQGLNNAIYQHNKHRLLPALHGGVDHSANFPEALAAIAVGDLETLERILPKGIGEAANGHSFNLIGTNLLMALWYKDKQLLEKTLPKGEKFTASKKPQLERFSIAYMAALARGDSAAAAAEHLQAACKAFMRADVLPYEKKLCLPAHGLYRLASYVLNKDDFEKIQLPNYKNFASEYAVWKNEHKETPKLYLTYPPELSILNEIYLQPAAICELHQPYLNSSNPHLTKHEKNLWFVNIDSMREKFVRDLVSKKI